MVGSLLLILQLNNHTKKVTFFPTFFFNYSQKWDFYNFFELPHDITQKNHNLFTFTRVDWRENCTRSSLQCIDTVVPFKYILQILFCEKLMIPITAFSNFITVVSAAKDLHPSKNIFWANDKFINMFLREIYCIRW